MSDTTIHQIKRVYPLWVVRRAFYDFREYAEDVTNRCLNILKKDTNFNKFMDKILIDESFNTTKLIAHLENDIYIMKHLKPHKTEVRQEIVDMRTMIDDIEDTNSKLYFKLLKYQRLYSK